MKVYNYAPVTGEYISSRTSRTDPLEPHKYLIPALATDIEPPASAAGEVAVFVDGAWSLQPDHRGETWFDDKAKPVEIDFIGDPAAHGLLAEKPVIVPTPDEVSALKARLSDQVDRDAEDIRSRYITTGAGQAMAYLEKASQAKAYLAAADPVDADYPLLVAEVGITGETVAEVATVIDAMQQQWVAICAEIEPIRIGAKEQIKAAETVEAAQAIYDAIEWPEA